VVLGIDVAKLKRDFIKTSFTTLVSKLVTNKRHSLYGLMSKTPPSSPQTSQSKLEQEKPLEVPHKSQTILCCFSGTESEPSLRIVFLSSTFFFFFLTCLVITQTTPPESPRVSPREEGNTMKRRALRSNSIAIGMVDVTGKYHNSIKRIADLCSLRSLRECY
jgi:hypothetical protein